MQQFFQNLMTLWGNLIESIFRGPGSKRARMFVDRFSPFLPHNRAHVLDLGCGTGHIGVEVAKMQHHATLLDVRPHWLYFGQWLFGVYCAKAMAQRYKLPYYLINGGDDLPFRANNFDAILLISVLHHARDPRAVLAEVARVLKPGGRIILNEDITHNWWETLLNHMADVIVNLELWGQHQNKTEGEWLRIFGECGLTVVHTESWVDRWVGLPVFPLTLFVLEKE